MSSISKQVSTENGSFYVLQSPERGESVYHIGRLIYEENSRSQRLGFFATYDGARTVDLGPNEAVLDVGELRSYLEKQASNAELRLSSTFKGLEAYTRVFESVQQAINLGRLKKAVLFQSVDLKDPKFPSREDFFSYLAKLLAEQTTGYLFAYYSPKDERAYVGLSPEFLCREQEGGVETVAVAGTKVGSGQVDEWSEKLKEEHQMVKDGIDELYKVVWSETENQKYGQLNHLRAVGKVVTGETVEKVSFKLHPTSAVGTLPRHEFLNFELGDLTHQDRGHFGGYALLNSSSPFSIVTIRGIEWSNKKAFVCIGGGVTAQSQLLDEWRELEKKWETFRGLWT